MTNLVLHKLVESRIGIVIQRLILLSVVLCLAAPITVRAENVADELAWEELYMAGYFVRSMLDSKKPPKIRYQYLILLSDGTACQAWPKEGIAGLSRERLLKMSKKKVGNFTRDDEKIEIHWVNQRGKKAHWTLTKHPEGWKRSEMIIYTRAKEMPPELLTGRYSLGQNSMSGGTRILPQPISMNTGNNTFTFRENGTFEKKVGKDRRKGTFEVDGYALNLKYEDGTEEVRSVYIWPAANSSLIGIDKKPWFLEFRTPSLTDKEQ